MKIQTILALSLFTFGVSCKSQKVENSKDPNKTETTKTEGSVGNSPIVKKDGLYILKEGQTFSLPTEKMNITFHQISEDSRCPKEVNCIWSGVAVADLEFTGFIARPRKANLASINLPSKGYQKSYEYQGYTISLEQVLPEKSNKSITKSGYTIGLKLEKNGNKPEIHPTK